MLWRKTPLVRSSKDKRLGASGKPRSWNFKIPSLTTLDLYKHLISYPLAKWPVHEDVHGVVFHHCVFLFHVFTNFFHCFSHIVLIFHELFVNWSDGTGLRLITETLCLRSHFCFEWIVSAPRYSAAEVNGRQVQVKKNFTLETRSWTEWCRGRALGWWWRLAGGLSVLFRSRRQR